ncbi:GMC family oxidoreductase [Natranaerofaba carboxydovora]|uniref:GMC family oxidoreductase n=1 Tax=Natranaerofaba carboxydovora TaxID=2742683 RepID=UPI001F14178E|nr:GMC family oxidoreductase [Natranaerofaba carboxydovora]UMZ72496.1 Gluconate 2-dehydrogenase flavoprotein [Natranaerofaba carboxydovora]
MSVNKKDANVIIVGFGCAGGILARELAESGLKVIALERGPNISSAQYSMDELRFPIRNKVLWGPQNEPQYTWRPNKSIERERIIEGLGGWGPGGDHLHWGANSWRFQPETFKAKTVFGQVENGAMIDWPISYEDLEPYYQLFEERIGVSGDHTKDPYHPPRDRSYPMPPTVPGYATRHFVDTASSMGYQPFPVPAAINSVDYDGRHACGYCGFCQSFGCVVEAKGDVGLTEIRKVMANPNFELRTNSTATKITVDNTNRASGVNYIDSEGCNRYVSGDIVIVASQYLQSTRLLLMSKSFSFPNGIGNNNGQVGRYFVHRAINQIIGLFDEPMNAFLGPTPRYAVNAFADNNFDPRDWDQNFIMGGNMTGAEPYGLAGQPIEFTQAPTPEGIPSWGEKYKKFISEAYTHHYTIRFYTTEPPQLNSFIDLDPKIKDSLGLPVPRVTFDWHPQAKEQFSFLQNRAYEILSAAGAKKIWGEEMQEPWVLSSHAGGSTRMGEDPNNSVVNRYCQSHEVPNLFVVGSSSMPVIGAYNPGETVGALAYWVADFIQKETRSGKQL